ncbi:MAG: hypothetical protein OEW67_07335 [Cyclobacteriaceae bacterium]|nr:hypothetical protein [Cyclobacteriaceae bacterium]
MRVFLILVYFFIATFCTAQQQFFIGGQMEFGYFLRKIESNEKTLSTSGLGSVIVPRLSLQYRIFNRISLEVGAALNRQKWTLHDTAFENRHEGFELNINNINRFHSYFGSLAFSQKIGQRRFIYYQIGYEYNVLDPATLSESKEFTLGNETVNMTTEYSDDNFSITPEIGFQWFGKGRGLSSLGLKYSFSYLDDIMKGEYTVKNNDQIISSASISNSGSFISINFRHNFSLGYIPKKERQPKKIKLTPEQPLTTDPPVEIEQEEIDVVKNENNVNDRTYTVTSKAKVSNSTVTVSVWDHQVVDGDIISLILNGKWILEDYKLKKEKNTFKINLKEGKNLLILYAKNLGKYVPNTAAMVVDDGIKKHQMILESDLDQSGALEIIYKLK